MRNFRDKICVVSGAASGIGAACARELAQRGAQVVMTDIRADMLGETQKSIEEAGGRGESHIVDAADRDAVFALADKVMARHGQVDLVLNNAGVAYVSTVADMQLDDFNWLMDINFWGVVHGTQAFLPHMLQRGSGYIANVSSVFGLFSVPTQAAYNAAKFAVLGFTDALRHEMADSNIGVSCIHPGGIKTNIVRHARFGQGPDMEERQQEAIASFEKMTPTTPDKATKIILRGIGKRKARILIGLDAVYFDLARRLFPTHYLRLLPLGDGLSTEQ